MTGRKIILRQSGGQLAEVLGLPRDRLRDRERRMRSYRYFHRLPKVRRYDVAHGWIKDGSWQP